MASFVKGHEKKGGRKKGSLNKATKLAQQITQEILTDEKYLQRLRRRLFDDQPPPALEKMIWTYAFGQPFDPNVLRKNTPPPAEKA